VTRKRIEGIISNIKYWKKLLDVNPRHHSILLVDDERDIVTTIKRGLEADGFRVYGFTDPLQALQYFQDKHDKIDLVLST
jgi:CheY-like chemotaxis protein